MVWNEILDLAQRAPSPHNVQPWRVRIDSDSQCTVYIDQSRTLPKEDVTGSFIVSGMVMYLETLRFAGENYGHRVSYSLLEEPAKDGLTPFATVNLVPDSTIVPSFSRKVILARRTSRLPQQAASISPEVHDQLSAIAKKYRQKYGAMNDSRGIEDILQHNITALFHDLNNPDYHDEIVSWFRFSTRKSERNRDGLDARCMQMSPAEYWLSANAPWIFKLPAINTILRNRYRTILGDTYCVAWISGDFWSREQAVDAGRFLIHFWLELTKMGLYIHPFGNLVTNLEAREWLEATTRTKDIWFVLRIGATTEPPESYRRNIAQVML